jgi:hypothetical protein
LDEKLVASGAGPREGEAWAVAENETAEYRRTEEPVSDPVPRIGAPAPELCERGVPNAASPANEASSRTPRRVIATQLLALP